MKQTLRILFFIASTIPTDEDFELAETLQGKVMFRNANFINDEDKPEGCDAVEGCVPESYKHFPSAKEALAKVEASKPKTRASTNKAPEAPKDTHPENTKVPAWTPNTPPAQ